MAKNKPAISPEELRKLAAQSEAWLKKHREEVWQEVASAALDCQVKAKTNLNRNGTNNEGTLQSGIKIFPNKAMLTADVSTTSGYGFYVEYGRKPGSFPPMDKLKRWVRLKLKVKEADVDGVTFAVGRKIAMRGTRPQPFMVPAYEAARMKFRKRLKALIKKK